MLVWTTWHPTVVASPTISHPKVDRKLVWSGHELASSPNGLHLPGNHFSSYYGSLQNSTMKCRSSEALLTTFIKTLRGSAPGGEATFSRWFCVAKVALIRLCLGHLSNAQETISTSPEFWITKWTYLPSVASREPTIIPFVFVMTFKKSEVWRLLPGFRLARIWVTMTTIRVEIILGAS